VTGENKRPAPSTLSRRSCGARGGDLLLEDNEVAASSQLCGASIAQLRGRLTTGATLLAVRREGTMLTPPPVDMLVQAGDIIAVAGTDSQLRILEQLCVGAPEALTTQSGVVLPTV
jgi:uncharacterized protein with PhoU and TrkA domain